MTTMKPMSQFAENLLKGAWKENEVYSKYEWSTFKQLYINWKYSNFQSLYEYLDWYEEAKQEVISNN